MWSTTNNHKTTTNKHGPTNTNQQIMINRYQKSNPAPILLDCRPRDIFDSDISLCCNYFQGSESLPATMPHSIKVRLSSIIALASCCFPVAVHTFTVREVPNNDLHVASKNPPIIPKALTESHVNHSAAKIAIPHGVNGIHNLTHTGDDMSLPGRPNVIIPQENDRWYSPSVPLSTAVFSFLSTLMSTVLGVRSSSEKESRS